MAYKGTPGTTSKSCACQSSFSNLALLRCWLFVFFCCWSESFVEIGPWSIMKPLLWLVIYGGLKWFEKESRELKSLQSWKHVEAEHDMHSHAPPGLGISFLRAVWRWAHRWSWAGWDPNPHLLDHLGWCIKEQWHIMTLSWTRNSVDLPKFCEYRGQVNDCSKSSSLCFDGTELDCSRHVTRVILPLILEIVWWSRGQHKVHHRRKR